MNTEFDCDNDENEQNECLKLKIQRSWNLNLFQLKTI